MLLLLLLLLWEEQWQCWRRKSISSITTTTTTTTSSSNSREICGICCWFSQFFQSMRKETDWSSARSPLFAQRCPVAGRVQPALENAVGKGAGVTTTASGFSEVGTRRTLIDEMAGVSAAGFLSGWVEIGAFVPVVEFIQVRARLNLQKQ